MNGFDIQTDDRLALCPQQNILFDQLLVLNCKALFISTGFLEPSGGTAIVNGYDIQTDIANVHKRTLGLCPQHNILFDQLTLKHYLYLQDF